VIIFGLIRFLLKKNNQTEFFLKKPKPVQTDRFRFGSIFLTKIGSNRFGSVWLGFFQFGSVWFFYKNRFKPVWIGFFGLARFFPVWLCFSSFWLGFFWFGFGLVFSILGL
jgi:hypothetical protein